MRIKNKLFIGFGALMFLMFALAAIGINRLSTIDASIKEVYGNRYVKVVKASELRDNTTDLAKALSNLLLNEDPANMGKNLEAIRSDSLKLNKSLTDMESGFKDKSELPMVAEISSRAKKLIAYKDDVVRLYRAGQKKEANQLRNESGAEVQQDFLDSISAMIQYQGDGIEQALIRAEDENSRTYKYTAILTVLSLVSGIAIMFWLVVGITRGLGMLSGVITNFGKGKSPGAYRIPIHTTDEFADIARIFNHIAEDLETISANERKLSRMSSEQAWLQTNIAHVSTELQAIRQLEDMSAVFIGELCRIIGAHSGAVYIMEQDGPEKRYRLGGAYARTDKSPSERIAPGEGIIGQAAADGQPITLTDVPAEYGSIGSAYGEIAALTLAVRPVSYENEVTAVFEVAAAKTLTELELQLLDSLCSVVAVTIHRIQGQKRVEELLRISQNLTEELQSQSEELLSQQDEMKASNEKLEEQTRALQVSEELLQKQQGVLEQTNEELLRKTKLLEEQVRETEEINRQIEHTKDMLEKQALELAFASKYKSEFMANMSHELRTPLNSLLILSQMLKENKGGNLTEKQVEYAETILSSSTDLLRLIDDILDLAKVESGRMELHSERVLVQDIADSLYKAFVPMARKKRIDYQIRIDERVPGAMHIDSLRLQQILKNLLSNAFKFTPDGGSVSLSVQPFANDPAYLEFAVADTGIGIPANKQQMIFEAFQQADGTTSRQYGGTGLGLSISRQLAGLLGGCIELESEVGQGSTFMLYVPRTAKAGAAGTAGTIMGGRRSEAAAALELTEAAEQLSAGVLGSLAALPQSHAQAGALEEADTSVASADAAALSAVSAGGLMTVADDRESIRDGDRTLLIVEDDVHFARILMDMARGRGFKTLVALRGDTGLQLAKQYKPDAIILDIQLPVVDGWSILVHLKNDVETRHIPIHVISVVDQVQQGLSLGAIAYLRKPSGRESLEEAFSQLEAFLEKGARKLLLVGDDNGQRKSLKELIGDDDVVIVSAAEAQTAWTELGRQQFDCMVIDMAPTDVAAFELLDRIKADEQLRRLPIIIYTDSNWEHKDHLRLKKYAESIIVKDVRSPERLLDETTLFLHRVEEKLPEEKRQILRKLHNKEEVFAGKKVLLVDDDIRNVFALSNLLESYDMQISFAETGRQALDRLMEEPDFDLVLMDIMMPEMDGYEAMREIRSMDAFESLPIIALTAKAMRDDREKCIQAGASDYITKPIHTEQLLSLIRVWLCQ
ncbi:response regulator [Paenibacillus piri]|uniref:Circadian input-output histidine kinase CikA n=1 Tax=Paenibacillus piri TaxID=2547395 RepID=A0A4R5KLR3_9BACL|nr:response regulator [Paenibacillus piri]TDF95517.1 response regulator [Paenibacillus piri]